MKNSTQNNNPEYQKALVYCRVSSGKQVIEGNGLESQEQRCIKYAQDKGYQIEQVFRDEGISGGLFERPAMQNLLDYLDANTSENYVVIFDDLKRFARDVRVHLQLKTIFNKHKAKLECPNFNFEETPEGEFVEIVMAATAQLERSQNRRQVIQKQKARLEAGYWSFHAPPGLKFQRDPVRGNIMVPNEPLASIYKSAYIKFAEFKLNTLEQVRLYILDQYRLHKVDRKLSLHGVTRILTCPLYAGFIQYEPWGVPLSAGKHDCFIPPDLFHAVQAKLQNKAKPRLRKDYNEDFPLRNYLYCVACRKPMTASWNKGRLGTKYPHYWCKNNQCELRYKVLARDVVQKDFEKALRKAEPDKEILALSQAILLDVWKERTEQEEQKQEGKRNELASIEGKITVLMDRITNGNLSSALIAQYESEISKLANKKTALEADIAKERYSRKEFARATDIVIGKLSDPMSLWKSDDLTEKRLLLSMYFENGIYYDRTKGLVKPELPLLVQYSSRKKFGSNKNLLVEMAGVKPASKTN